MQGNFREHVAMLRRLGAEPVEVRKPEQLDDLDGLVIPGGESTAIARLVRLYGLEQAIRAFERPVFGTCAGMILLAADVLDGRPDQLSFGAIDIGVRRNGFGRQVDSFEADLAVTGVGGLPVHAVFIRAPFVEWVGAGVEVLAEVDGHPVAVRQGPMLALSFHPELGDDDRLHRLFLEGLG